MGIKQTEKCQLGEGIQCYIKYNIYMVNPLLGETALVKVEWIHARLDEPSNKRKCA